MSSILFLFLFPNFSFQWDCFDTRRYCLVVMPCKQDAKGYVFTDEELVKEVLRTRENNNNTTVSLFASSP